MQKSIYTYTVEQRDVDFSGRATHVALIDYLLQAAGDDADNKGFGVSDLNQGNCSWVLTRFAVEFGERPGCGSTITVATWVSDVNRFGTTRNMVVSGEGGETIAMAVTQWAVIDLDRRAAINLTELVDCSFALVDEAPPVAMPLKVAPLTPERKKRHTVVYSDIDFNRHVNAARYITWMFDMLPVEYFTGWRLARFDVNFISEARYGDEVEIGYRTEGGKSLFSISSIGGGALCRASMVWEPDADPNETIEL